MINKCIFTLTGTDPFAEIMKTGEKILDSVSEYRIPCESTKRGAGKTSLKYGDKGRVMNLSLM